MIAADGQVVVSPRHRTNVRPPEPDGGDLSAMSPRIYASPAGRNLSGPAWRAWSRQERAGAQADQGTERVWPMSHHRDYDRWMTISLGSSGVVEEKATSLRGWAELIRERFVPLQIAPHDAAEMRGSVKTRQFGYLQASTVRSAPQTFTRTRSLVAKEDSPLFALGLVDKGVGYLEQDGRECTVTDGGFALYDTSRPFTWHFGGPFRMRVYTWPLGSVSLASSEAQRVTAINVPRAQGIGRLLGPLFLQLMQETPGDLSAPGSMRMAGELAELAITAGLEAGQAPPTRDGEILRTIQLFIEERLSDPTLNADQIAAGFYMSTRTLHRLFARHNLTVAGWIKMRRLEGCRRALVSSSSSDEPIRDVAARYGFLNASFFSREFAQQYGASPRQYRLSMQA